MANVEFPEYVIVFCSNWAGCRHVWFCLCFFCVAVHVFWFVCMSV